MSTGLSDCEKRQQLATGEAGRQRAPPGVEEQLLVRVGPALKMLGNPGRARLYEWINDGTIDSFLIGRTRFLVFASLKRLIATRLAQARDEDGRVRLYTDKPHDRPPHTADGGGTKARRERHRANTEQTRGG